MRDIHKRDNRDDGTAVVGRVRGLDGKVRPSRRLDNTGRDAEIVERLNRGESYRAIASAVGCSIGTAHRVVAAARTRA